MTTQGTAAGSAFRRTISTIGGHSRSALIRATSYTRTHRAATIAVGAAVAVIVASGVGVGVYAGKVSTLQNALSAQNTTTTSAVRVTNASIVSLTSERAKADRLRSSWTKATLTGLRHVADSDKVTALNTSLVALGKAGSPSAPAAVAVRSVTPTSHSITALNAAIHAAKVNTTIAARARTAPATERAAIVTAEKHIAIATHAVAVSIKSKRQSVLGAESKASGDSRSAYDKARAAAVKNLTPATAAKIVTAYTAMAKSQSDAVLAATPAAPADASGTSTRSNGSTASRQPSSSSSGGRSSGTASGSRSGGGGAPAAPTAPAPAAPAPAAPVPAAPRPAAPRPAAPRPVTGYPVRTQPPLPANSTGSGSNCGSGAIPIPSNAVITSQGYSASQGCYNITYTGPGVSGW